MKVIKKITALFLALSLALVFVLPCYADTIYQYGGYTYKYDTANHIIICGLEEPASEVTFPSEIEHKEVISVGLFAFQNDATVTSVSFEGASNLMGISAYAFSGCVNLENVILTPQITVIDRGAFSGDSLLRSINLQDSGISEVSISLFQNCTSLTTITLPDNVKAIRSMAFANCTSLQTVIIGPDVTEIADNAFDNDPNLVIYGFAGSYAQTYAHEHNIPFVEMVKFLLGDVDGVDGVNINDVTAIQSHLAELKTVEGVYLLAADANQDDVVDISDATAIQMKLAEYELPYPIGQYVTKEVVAQENN